MWYILLGAIVLFFYRYGVIMRFKRINLGSLHTLELTILEWKPAFSLKLFYFFEGESQEVFHTHSFSAYSFLIFGDYTERFFNPSDRKETELPRSSSVSFLSLNRGSTK